MKTIRPYHVFCWYKHYLIWGKISTGFFNTANNELSNFSHWFNSKKLSLNADKTKFTLFSKVRQRDKIPLVLPTLKVNNTLIKREVFRSLIQQKSNMEREKNIKKPRYLKSSQIFVKPEI